MLGELAGEDEADGRLDLARAERLLLGEAADVGGLVADALEEVGDEVACFLVGVAFLISNLMPFFGTITGFASAISGTIICWTLPYIFALKVGDLTSFEAASMKALVPVTIIIAVVGVVATVMDMINKIGDQKGAPFGCSSN